MNEKRKTQITVIGDSKPELETERIALEVGEMIGKLGAIAITGGRGGVMKAVAKGIDKAGGICVGILPTNEFSESNAYNHIVIPTDIGHARNSITVMAGDLVIAIGGGAGTLSEISFAWIYGKTVFAYEGSEGWSKALANQRLDEKRRDQIIGFKSVSELEKKIKPLIRR
ncbi:TIGR00725 family protein [Fulvitalea axinellae]